jgi:hypothetical protein
MDDQREITKEYLDLFISTVKRGCPMIYVEGSQLLAVDHPTQGYLVLQLRDKVVDTPEKKDITLDS